MKRHKGWIIPFILSVCVVIVLVVTGLSTKQTHKNSTEEGDSTMNVRMFQSYYQFSCNVYVISSDKGNILIDPGHYDEEIRDYLNEIGGLDAVLLTHGHWDHTYGLDALKQDYPDAPVYISEDGYDFLTDSYLNGSSWNGFDLIVQTDPTTIREGNLKVAGYDIDVINTPGHCRGCVLYYFKNENVLFTGDTIMRDVASPIRVTGSAEEQKASIKKFVNLGYKDDTPVYPGHGSDTTYGYLLENNVEVKEIRR